MHVSLAPVTADLVGDLATWREDASQRSEFDDFGPEEPGRLARAFAHTGLPNLLLVMVTASDPPGGHLAGMVSWRASQYGPNAESQGWNIGVSLKPQYRGAGIGTAAHRLLVGHLFATTDVLRLEAGTDITNARERAVLTRVGFRLEGVLRGAQYRRGAYHDMAIYGLLRSDHLHPAT